MLRGLSYFKRVIAAEQAHSWRKQIPSANRPISSSSSRNSYTKKRRKKWRTQPDKNQLVENFAFRLAKQSFKQSIRKDKTHLLPDLMSSFSAYEINPNPQSYNLLFKILLNRRPPNFHDQIRQILDHIEKAESFETPETVFVELIGFYGGVGMFDEAVELFLRIPRFRCEPSVESLNALLSVLCRNKRGLEMVPRVLVESTQTMKIRVEESSFGILIKALCGIRSVGNAFDLMNQMVEEGFCVDGKGCSLMLDTICREPDRSYSDIMGFIESLKKLGFEPRKDDFRNVIRFLSKKGESKDALVLLKRMKLSGIKPDIICYNLVLDGLIGNKKFSSADKVFDEMLVLGFVPDVCTYNVYISGLIAQKKVADGMRILDSMEELGCRPDSSTYNTIVRALYEAGEMARVTEVVTEMRRKCMPLNAQTNEILVNGLLTEKTVKVTR